VDWRQLPVDDAHITCAIRTLGGALSARRTGGSFWWKG